MYSNQFAALKLAFRFWDPLAITEYRLTQLRDEEYIAAVEAALGEKDIAEAQTVVALAQENGRELPPDLVKRTQESTIEFGLRTAWSFAWGAITGEVSDAASITGALAADYFGVGDVRDVLMEGAKLAKGEDYNQFTLGLSLAGLATVVPGSGAADVGFSLAKTAKKAGKLSKGMTARVNDIIGRLIDFDGLKRGLSRSSLPTLRMPSMTALRETLADVDWGGVARGDFATLKKPIAELMPLDVSAAKNAFSGAFRKEALDELEMLTRSASGITRDGGIKGAFRAMEHAENAEDLSRFRSLAAHTGDKTSGVLRVLKKSAIVLRELAFLVIAVLIAVFGWILGVLWLSYSVTHAVYRGVKRGRGAV